MPPRLCSRSTASWRSTWTQVWALKLGLTHRPLSSSFLGLPYRTLNINHKKELHRGLWVGLGFRVWAVGLSGPRIPEPQSLKAQQFGLINLQS